MEFIVVFYCFVLRESIIISTLLQYAATKRLLYCQSQSLRISDWKLNFNMHTFSIGRYLGYIRWPTISSDASSLDSNGTRIFACVCHNIWTKLFKHQKVFRGNKRAKGRLSGTPFTKLSSFVHWPQPNIRNQYSDVRMLLVRNYLFRFGCQPFLIYNWKYHQYEFDECVTAMAISTWIKWALQLPNTYIVICFHNNKF